MINIVKLVSGVELIGTITSVENDVVSVLDPLRVLYTIKPSGTPAVVLQRYIPFSTTGTFNFKMSHVEAICDPIEGLEKYYDDALKTIKEEVDPGLVADLQNINSASDASDYDSYLAMLEHLMSKKPLN